MQHVLPSLRPQSMGVSVPRAEDPRLLTGSGEFVADVSLPGVLHAAFVRSLHAHAQITAVETDPAAATAGVHVVWTAADTTPLCQGLDVRYDIEGFRGTVQPLLAEGAARYVGEAIAVVVAESRAIAEDACALIEVEFEPLGAALDAEEAISSSVVANRSLEDNVVLDRKRTFGDVAEAFESAAHVVRGRYRSARCAAVPMETRGCLASFRRADGELTLWSSTQMPHLIRSLIAQFAGIADGSLRVIAPDVGGGFGQKSMLFPEEVTICLLARELGRPVQWIEDRSENLAVATHAKQQVNEMELALSAEGKVLAIRDRLIGDGGAYNECPFSQLVEAMAGSSNMTSVYRIPSVEDHLTSVVTNKCPAGAYRGIGWTALQIARESLFDRAASVLGLSPFEIRRRNVVAPEEFPFETPQGLVLHEGSYRESLDALETAVGYEAFLDRQRDARDEGRYLGLGISLFNEITGMGTSACYHLGWPVTTHDTSTVRMEPSGWVTVTTSIVSQGQGHETTMAQVAADALGVEVDSVTVRAGDTGQVWGNGTWGSRAAVIGAGSIVRAAEPIRDKLARTAAHKLEVAPEDIVLERGSAHVAGTPNRNVSIGELAAAFYFGSEHRPEDLDPALEATAAFDPSYMVISNGAHAALVEVDTETGAVHVERFYAVEDCGKMINPMLVEGQIHGGVAQAIGLVLMEEMVYDESGQLLTTTFMDYLVPGAAEVPDVEMVHLETPSAFTPGGIKGMGESAMISAPAAIVNAVNDALSPFGVLFEEVPITPQRIPAALASLASAST